MVLQVEHFIKTTTFCSNFSSYAWSCGYSLYVRDFFHQRMFSHSLINFIDCNNFSLFVFSSTNINNLLCNFRPHGFLNRHQIKGNVQPHPKKFSQTKKKITDVQLLLKKCFNHLESYGSIMPQNCTAIFAYNDTKL